MVMRFYLLLREPVCFGHPLFHRAYYYNYKSIQITSD
jgi:hypothetical protein